MVSISFMSYIFGRYQTVLTYIETDATRPSWRFTVRRCYSHQIQFLSCDRERVIMSTHHLDRSRRCRTVTVVTLPFVLLIFRELIRVVHV